MVHGVQKCMKVYTNLIYPKMTYQLMHAFPKYIQFSVDRWLNYERRLKQVSEN